MFQHILVPVDGSDRAWAAARFGAVVADACAADLEIVHVVADESHAGEMRSELGRSLEEHGLSAANAAIVPIVAPPESDGSAGAAIAAYAEAVDGSMVVMSSTGRGRSAAVLGSVADDVLRSMFGPIIVVGPHVQEIESFSGDLIVPVDGSDFSEKILPIAGAWGVALGARPWIVEVITEQVPTSSDMLESSYPHRLANALYAQTHHEVEFEVLHGDSAAASIASYAGRVDARLIMMTTHGRTGMKRFTTGSTASSVVHTATVPVVLYRPPVLALD